jgi:heme/copper-type cytochrome/quinol oxidase subunit 4
VNPFKKFPLATLAAWATTVLAVLIYLQSTGVLTGTAAHWADVIAGVIQVLLTLYARMHVTPVADPKDNLGRALVPAELVPGRGITRP